MAFRLLALWLAVLMSLLVSLPAAANDAAVLAALRQQQLALYSTMRDFHMLTVLAGDPTRAARLKEQVAALGKSIDQLPANSGNVALDEAVKTIRKEWPMFRKSALGNRIGGNGGEGYTESYVLVDMRAANTRLQAALVKAIAAVPADAASKKTEPLHAAAFLIEKVTNEYAFIAADESGGMAVAPGEGEQIFTDKLTREIDARLARLLVDFKGQPAVLTQLNLINSKWNFVRKNLLEISKQSVPYVVDRYAMQIGDAFNAATRAAAGK